MSYFKKILKKNKLAYYLNDNLKYFFYNLRYFLTKNDNLQLIEVPRSGTTLLKKILRSLNVKIKHNNHFIKPKYNFNKKYVICIRNPVDRFLSAFYHTIQNQRITFYINYFENSPNINSLINELPSKKIISYIRLSHHLQESLSTFLDVDSIKKNPPVYIFDYSTLHNDIRKFFEKDDKNNKKEIERLLDRKFGMTKKDIINEKNYKILKKFLQKDFEVYKYLVKIKKNINSQF